MSDTNPQTHANGMDDLTLSRMARDRVMDSPEVVSLIRGRIADALCDPQPTLTRDQFFGQFPD